MVTVFAEWDGQRRGLRGTPATIDELTAAVRTAYGWSTEPLLKFSVRLLLPAQTALSEPRRGAALRQLRQPVAVRSRPRAAPARSRRSLPPKGTSQAPKPRTQGLPAGAAGAEAACSAVDAPVCVMALLFASVIVSYAPTSTVAGRGQRRHSDVNRLRASRDHRDCQQERHAACRSRSALLPCSLNTLQWSEKKQL